MRVVCISNERNPNLGPKWVLPKTYQTNKSVIPLGLPVLTVDECGSVTKCEDTDGTYAAMILPFLKFLAHVVSLRVLCPKLAHAVSGENHAVHKHITSGGMHLQ